MKLRILIVILTLFDLGFAQAGGLRADLSVAEKCLSDSKRNPRFIIINKFQKKTAKKPALFKSHVFDRRVHKWVDRFESLAGEGGIGCVSNSLKTPPGILEIKAEGSRLGAEHWGLDRVGYKKYFMEDVAGSYCDSYARKNGKKHRSHNRQIRFHSNVRMTKTKANSEQSKGCFVISQQKFKQWGGGVKKGFPGNAIVYNVPPKGMKLPKLKCKPSYKRLLTKK